MRESTTVYSLQSRYLEMRRMIDAGYSDVAETIKCSDLGRPEWLPTRRGLIGITQVVTPTPTGAPLTTWVWFTESGDTGMIDGPAGRSTAIADAYVAMVRREHPAPEWTF